jgi:hypothetical protein
MSNLLAKLGFTSQKPKVVDDRPAEKIKADNETLKKRLDLQSKWAKEAALLYHEMIPDEVIEKLRAHHDYKCHQWGGRRFGRLVNWCSNCLDIEINNEDGAFEEADRKHALTLLVWMSLLFPIPIKGHLKRSNNDAYWRKIFESIFLKGKHQLRHSEFELVMAAVFEGSSSDPGNPLLDIFHDAVRFEETQYIDPVPIHTMRTLLGKNPAFRTKAHKEVRANLSPHWVFELQKLKGMDGELVDVEKAKRDEEYSTKDAIS